MALVAPQRRRLGGGGGGAAYGFMTANIRPMKPWGVQLASPIVAPGRETRTSSAAAASWCGANITPTQDMTTSNEPSAKGRASASPCRQSSSTPAASAVRRPASSSSGARSLATTRAPSSGGDGGVARPRGDVEHVLPGLDVAGLDEDPAELRDDLARHCRVVAQRPHRGVPGLEGGVGRRGLLRAGVCGHGCFFPSNGGPRSRSGGGAPPTSRLRSVRRGIQYTKRTAATDVGHGYWGGRVGPVSGPCRPSPVVSGRRGRPGRR